MRTRIIAGLLLTLVVGACELHEITIADAEDVVVAEIVLRAGAPVQTAYLHRTSSALASARVPDAVIAVRDEGTLTPGEQDYLDALTAFLEMYDESHLKDELLAAQMKLELGEIDDEEFSAIEEQVLAGLREIGVRKRGITPAEKVEGDAPRTYSIESVSADFSHREEPED